MAVVSTDTEREAFSDAETDTGGLISAPMLVFTGVAAGAAADTDGDPDAATVVAFTAETIGVTGTGLDVTPATMTEVVPLVADADDGISAETEAAAGTEVSSCAC